MKKSLGQLGSKLQIMISRHLLICSSTANLHRMKMASMHRSFMFAWIAVPHATGHLPGRCRVRQCAPDFHHINIVERHRKQLVREILEASAINTKKDRCGSAAFVALNPEEKMYTCEEHPMWETIPKERKQ